MNPGKLKSLHTVMCRFVGPNKKKYYMDCILDFWDCTFGLTQL